jgi:hypothetical protein
MAIVQPVTENRKELRPVARNPVVAADFSGGEILGRAVAQAGEQAGNFVEQQNLINIRHAETAARDADNQATLARQRLYYEGDQAFFNQEGRNAINAAPALQAERERIDREALANLHDPLSQRLYRDVATRRRIADNEQISRHLHIEGNRYEDSVDEDALRVATSGAVNAADNPAEIVRQIDTADTIVERSAVRHGLGAPGSPEVVNRQRRAAANIVGAVADRIRQRPRTEGGGPGEAQAFIVSMADRIDPVEATRLLRGIEDEAAQESANRDVEHYLVTTGTEEQATAPPNATPGNARPTPVPPNAAVHAAIGAQESGSRERGPDGRVVTSRAGAQGMMQVMPDTERQPGFNIRPGNGTDADRSRVGRELYDALLRHYNGNITLALTAYNWGQGRVDAHIRTHGDPRTGRVSDAAWLASIPNSEARNYAPAVLRRLGETPAASAASPQNQAPTYQGEEINLAATINRIEADRELSYPQQRALIAAARERHGLGAQARQEAEQRVADLGYTAMTALGDNYTRYEQLPLNVRRQIDANPRLAYQFHQIAESNLHEAERRAAAGPPAYGQQFMDLLEASQGGPQDRALFQRVDLRSPRYNITNGERAELMRVQGSYRRAGEEQDRQVANREAVNVDRVRTYVGRVAVEGRFAPGVRGARMTEPQRQNFVLLTQRVIDRVRARQAEKHDQVTDEELQGIVASEVRPVTVVTQGWFGERRGNPIPGYLARQTAEQNPGGYVRTEIEDVPGVPRAAEQAIVDAYRRENANAYPSPAQIADLYHRRRAMR